ncbi:MAG: transporter substrate-binding domain-containing protein [Oligoflexia bacterium]|nr:transporter substrate-binding domain-containing protein [Oligoflexia bacterium]
MYRIYFDFKIQRKIFVSCFISLFIALIQMVCVWGNENFQQSKRDFKIGVQDFEEYMPESLYKDGEYFGFARDLLDMFAHEYGYNFTYIAAPIRRLNHNFYKGDVDFQYPDNEYWASNSKGGKNIKYSDPVVKYIDGIMVLKENLGKGIKDIKLLGIVMGYTPFLYLDAIKAGTIKLSENSLYESLLKQIILKRIDGAYSNISVSKYYLKKYFKNSTDELVFNDSLPYTKSTRHLSTIKYPKIIDEFNSFLIKKKNDIDRLKRKYKIEEEVDKCK